MRAPPRAPEMGKDTGTGPTRRRPASRVFHPCPPQGDPRCPRPLVSIPPLPFARTSPRARPTAGWRGGRGSPRPAPRGKDRATLPWPLGLGGTGASPDRGDEGGGRGGWAAGREAEPRRGTKGGVDAKNLMKAVNSFNKHVETDTHRYARTHTSFCI